LCTGWSLAASASKRACAALNAINACPIAGSEALNWGKVKNQKVWIKTFDEAGLVRTLKYSIQGLSSPDTAGDRNAASTISFAGARRRTARWGIDVVGGEALFCVERTIARSDGAADLRDLLSGCMA
jgi:hypothetical protein